MTALLARPWPSPWSPSPGERCHNTSWHGLSAEVNVAVAVAMEDGGLITPVLRQADRTDL